MKPWQWAVIIAEVVLLCGVLGTFAWLVLSSPALQPQIIAQGASTPTPSSPTATVTRTPTPFVWGTPLPTRTPFPTNTRVISRVSLNQRTIDQIEQQVTTIRNLKPRATVKVEFLTHDEMLNHVRQQYEASREGDEQLALYRALGLAQPGVKVNTDAVVTVTASSIAGFYRPEDKHLYVISDVENMDTDNKVTLAHEYTHALQDQYFNLAQYQSRIHTTDARLAMMALPEGDATVVMSIYLYGNTTRSDWEYLAYRASFSDRSVITATGLSTRTGEIAYFPYMQGAEFVVALLLDGKGWAEINHAYADPPQSTSQVLHPARYLTSHATPVPVALPDLGPTLGTDWSPTIKRDTLGEFITSVHLDEFLHDPQRAAQAADGWVGDGYSLWQAAGDKQAFAWQIVWDTPRDVGEFFDAYSDLLRKRIGEDRAVEREDTDVRWYSGSVGSGLIQQDSTGERTLVLWGPDKATVEKLLFVFK
jgi:hypothetical protein